MKRYAHYGFHRFILCLGYLQDVIREYFTQPENREAHWDITCVDTGLDVSKAERVLAVKEYITTDHFLLSYGDDLSSVEIDKLVTFHQQKGKIVTLTSVPLFSQFGVLEINDNHEVCSFREKPRIEQFWINGGFFVFHRDIFNYLHLGELEKEVFERLAAERQIAAYRFEGFWKGMNTAKDCQEFNQLFESGNAPWLCWKENMS
jgi:glucose-1-phosphate cytidylyltransferase